MMDTSLRSSWLSLLLALCVPVLVASPAHAADPTVSECLSASDASLTSAGNHQLRAERRALLICASPSCPTEIKKECARRVDEVNAALPTVVFEAKNGAGKDLTDVKVSMDGEVLAERLDGTALAVDPGKHTFVFETAGEATVTEELVTREGEKGRRETIQFGTPAAPATGGGSHDAGANGGGLSRQKVAAIVVASIGVASLGTGGAFGVIAMQKKKDAEKLCPGDECPDQTGSDAWSKAKTAGTISTIGFAVGGAAIAGAALLWFTAPQAQLEVGLGSIHVRGTF